MNWLRKLINFRDKQNAISPVKEQGVLVSSSPSIDSRGMNFTVYRADGGYVLENRVYDHTHDRSNNKLYIITDDKNLGEEIARVITFESLRS